jgi:dTDP-4-dehydrorhamnose reductase
MLGGALQAVAASRGIEAFAPDEAGFDITSPEQVSAAIGDFARAHPDGVVINSAAYTNVEKAEDDSATAYRVNQYGAGLLAESAAARSLAFVHVSTDFVFDGTKSGAYTELDAPNPLSVYGASKLAGEYAVSAAHPGALIVRTAWSFGPGAPNFPSKILEAAKTRDTLQVVSDEVGSPTYTVDLATALLGLIDIRAMGTFHVAGSGWCSRDELARETLRLAGREDVVVQSVRSDAFPSKAERPHNSVLDCSKAAGLGVTMPTWRDALARFVEATK